MRLTCAIAAIVLFGLVRAEDAGTPSQPAKPDAAKPEAIKPDAGKVDAVKPDAAKSLVPMPQSAMVKRPPIIHSEPSLADIIARTFHGLGLDSPKSVRWEMMLSGMDKNFLTNLQVGSVQNPGTSDFP